MSWWQDYFRDADSRDVEKTAAWYSPDIELHFAGSDPMHGKEGATEAFRQFTSSMSQMKHSFALTFAHGDEVFLDTHFSCRLKDGQEVTAKMATYLRRENGLIRDMRGYGDLSGVMTAMASAG